MKGFINKYRNVTYKMAGNKGACVITIETPNELIVEDYLDKETSDARWSELARIGR